MEISKAGIFSRDGSAAGSPVSGLTPDGIVTCGLGVELGTVDGTMRVGVGVCVLVWQAVKNRMVISSTNFFTFEYLRANRISI